MKKQVIKLRMSLTAVNEGVRIRKGALIGDQAGTHRNWSPCLSLYL